MIKSCFLALAILLGWLAIAQAQVWVSPYARRDGTQVQGHWRSNPDGNPYNNWSYPGNVNPYTGKQATGDPNRYLTAITTATIQTMGTTPTRTISILTTRTLTEGKPKRAWL
jgi:hypothetical protein